MTANDHTTAGGESPLGVDLVAMARRVEWQLLTQVGPDH